MKQLRNLIIGLPIALILASLMVPLSIPSTTNTDLSKSMLLADGRLQNGITVSGYLDNSGDTEIWFINVQPNALAINIILNGAYSSDFDVYGRWTSLPTTDLYDIRGFSSDSYEDVTYEYPSDGRWYIMARSYEGYGSYDLTVHISYHDPTTSVSSTTNPITYPTSTTTVTTFPPPQAPNLFPSIETDDIPILIVMSLSILGLVGVLYTVKQ